MTENIGSAEGITVTEESSSEGMSDASEWFYGEKGQYKGPVSEKDAVRLIEAGELGYRVNWKRGGKEQDSFESSRLPHYFRPISHYIWKGVAL